MVGDPPTRLQGSLPSTATIRRLFPLLLFSTDPGSRRQLPPACRRAEGVSPLIGKVSGDGSPLADKRRAWRSRVAFVELRTGTLNSKLPGAHCSDPSLRHSALSGQCAPGSTVTSGPVTLAVSWSMVGD